MLYAQLRESKPSTPVARDIRDERLNLTKRFDNMEKILQQHYEWQLARLGDVIHELVEFRKQKDATQKEEARLLDEYIFQPNVLIRLLILAEDVACDELRNACVAKMAPVWDTYMLSPLLRCLLIKEDTYKAVFARLPTHILDYMNNNPTNCPISLVKRELQYRKLLAREKVRKETYETLKGMMKDPDYKALEDVLSQEIEFRLKVCDA